jgi:hypothetical protein
VLQKPAEPLLAADLFEADNGWRIIVLVRVDQPVANPLMWAAFMIVGDGLADNVGEMDQAKLNEMRLLAESVGLMRTAGTPKSFLANRLPPTAWKIYLLPNSWYRYLCCRIGHVSTHIFCRGTINSGRSKMCLLLGPKKYRPISTDSGLDKTL